MTNLKSKILLLLVLSFFFKGFSQSDNFASLLSDSQRFIMIGDLDTAETILLSLYEDDKNSGAVNYSLSKLYSVQGYFKEALLYSINSIEIEQNNLWYNRQLLNIYQNLQYYEDAKKIFFDILKITNTIIDFENASSFFKSNLDSDSEIKVYEIAKERNFENYEFEKRTIELYKEQNLTNKLTKECDLFLEKYNFNPESYNFIANIYIDLQDYEKAEIIIQQGVKEFNDKNYFDLLYSQISIIKNDYDNFNYYFSNSLKSNYNSSQDYLDILTNNDSFFYNYDNKKYIILLNLLDITFKEDFNVQIFLANEYFKRNNFYRAIDTYEYVLNLEPTNFENYTKLLNLYSRFQLFSKLDSLSTIATELFPAQPIVYLFKGIAGLHLENFDDSYQALVFGKSLVFNEPELSAYFSFYISQYYRIQKNISNENLYLNNALSSSSKNCDLHAYFAFYYSRYTNLNKKAIDIIGDCIINDNLSSSINYIYSFILFKNKDYSGALNYCLSAIELSRHENFLHFELLGNIYQKLEKEDKANEAWHKSVELGNLYINKTL